MPGVARIVPPYPMPMSHRHVSSSQRVQSRSAILFFATAFLLLALFLLACFVLPSAPAALSFFTLAPPNPLSFPLNRFARCCRSFCFPLKVGVMTVGDLGLRRIVIFVDAELPAFALAFRSCCSSSLRCFARLFSRRCNALDWIGSPRLPEVVSMLSRACGAMMVLL